MLRAFASGHRCPLLPPASLFGHGPPALCDAPGPVGLPVGPPNNSAWAHTERGGAPAPLLASTTFACCQDGSDPSIPRLIQVGPSSLPVSDHQQTLVLWKPGCGTPRQAAKGQSMGGGAGSRAGNGKRQLGAGLRPREGQVTQGIQVASREARKHGPEPGKEAWEVRPEGQL